MRDGTVNAQIALVFAEWRKRTTRHIKCTQSKLHAFLKSKNGKDYVEKRHAQKHVGIVLFSQKREMHELRRKNALTLTAHACMHTHHTCMIACCISHICTHLHIYTCIRLCWHTGTSTGMRHAGMVRYAGVGNT